MLTKHQTPFLMMCSLLILATVFAYLLPQAKKNFSGTEKLDTFKTKKAILPRAKQPETLMARLSFANETLPLGDKKIELKMKKSLKAHNYKNTQTYRLQKRAREWFPIIEPILKRFKIPNDFKYMALVESGYKSGVSSKGAAGVWQFMPGTARNYGLKVGKGVDERYNLKKATIAACEYLKEMHGTLKSWTLVAAAYNVGDVKIRKRINKQNQDNYFKLKLNGETGIYVYKLISMKQIIEHPARYGYDKPKELLAYN
ncbi:membrane-bound lytic murein transglycosylase D [Pedobacter sp. UYP30]|uniref:lytic transglycosylase domain-containing protein n=1 Tax=Pedobacter sp. UYP30 TaxID=1756400 RepID=UPI0033928162